MQFITVLILGILCGAEIDLFVPSFPELQKVFSLTPFMVELTLGVNLVAHCVTALIVGNLGDRYGRKPIIIIGLIIFIIGSICCVFAPKYWVMLLGRLLQGLGISGPTVLGYLIIADLYPIKKQQQLMGLLNGVITLAMAFSPVVGSYVNLFFNWQGNFVVLLILGVISLMFSIVFIPKGKSSLEVGISFREYLPVFKSKSALYYIVVICLGTQAYWIFIGMSPILYMDDLGVSLKEFGFYQGSIAAVYAIGSLSSGYFISKFGQKNCFYTGVILIIAFIICTCIVMLCGIQDPLTITIIMQISAAGVIFPINILWPLSLETVKNAKARIQAIVVSSRLLLTAICIQIVSYVYDGTFLYIGIAMCITLIMALYIGLALLKEDKVFE